MIKIIFSFFFLALLLTGCFSKKDILQSKAKQPLTQREMDISGAIEFIQFENQDCKGECRIRVSNKFKYFDNCLMIWDSIYFKSIGLDVKKEFIYPEQIFRLKDFGIIYFTNDEKDLNYSFAPFLYNQKKHSLEGQVLITGLTKVSFAMIILRNKLYMSSDYYYPLDNCY